MMRRGGLVLAGGLAVGVLASACAPSEKEPVVTVTAAESHINDTGASTTLTITVLDEAAQKGTGVVRVTTKVGMFGEEGNNTLVTLSEGSATVPFTCPAARDSACALGVASISADWRGNVGRGKVYVGERGLLLLQGKTGTSGPFPTPTPTPTAQLNPRKVYFSGEVGPRFEAVCDPETPRLAHIAFPSTEFKSKTIRLDGSLIYRSGGLGNKRARKWVPDAITYNSAEKLYTYPPADKAILNDPIIPTPKCDDDMHELGWLYVLPDTGRLIYGCINTSTAWDEDGNVYMNNTSGLLKLGTNGTKLVHVTIDLRVLDANNAETFVTGGISGENLPWWQFPIRAVSDGFLIVIAEEFSTHKGELWHISHGGQMTLKGKYPALPINGIRTTSYNGVLDAEGNLYVGGTPSVGNTTMDDFAIAKLPLQPGTPKVVYTEVGAPVINWRDATSPPSLFVRYDVGNYLFSGP